jgi:hypothetical protein
MYSEEDRNSLYKVFLLIEATIRGRSRLPKDTISWTYAYNHSKTQQYADEHGLGTIPSPLSQDGSDEMDNQVFRTKGSDLNVLCSLFLHIAEMCDSSITSNPYYYLTKAA